MFHPALFRLDGAIALVTGAGAGIGRALGIGCNVTAHDGGLPAAPAAGEELIDHQPGLHGRRAALLGGQGTDRARDAEPGRGAAMSLFGWFVVLAVLWQRTLGTIYVSPMAAAVLVGLFAGMVTVLVEVRTKRALLKWRLCRSKRYTGQTMRDSTRDDRRGRS